MSTSPSASVGGATERSRLRPVRLAERALCTAMSASRPSFSKEACAVRIFQQWVLGSLWRALIQSSEHNLGTPVPHAAHRSAGSIDKARTCMPLGSLRVAGSVPPGD